MAQKRPRLIAFDLDDTALKDGAIPERLREQLAAFCGQARLPACRSGRPDGQGGILSTASGRHYSVQEDILRQSGITGAEGFPQFIISADKFIHRLDAGRYIPVSDWNEAILRRWRRILPEIVKRLPHLSVALEAQGLCHAPIGDVQSCEERGYVAMQFSDVPAAVAAMDVMARMFKDIKEASINRAACYSAVTLRDTGKGEALRRVASEVRVHPSEVLAVGDSYNDISMLDGRYGFQSAAVANAEPVVKIAVEAAHGCIAQGEGADGFGEIMALVLEGRWGGC
jgi:hypothetical protein